MFELFISTKVNRNQSALQVSARQASNKTQGDVLVKKVKNIINQIERSTIVPAQNAMQTSQRRQNFVSKNQTASANPKQLVEMTRRCKNLVDGFYVELKMRHLKAAKCKLLLAKPVNERKAVMTNQLKDLLNHFSRELTAQKG